MKKPKQSWPYKKDKDYRKGVAEFRRMLRSGEISHEQCNEFGFLKDFYYYIGRKLIPLDSSDIFRGSLR